MIRRARKFPPNPRCWVVTQLQRYFQLKFVLKPACILKYNRRGEDSFKNTTWRMTLCLSTGKEVTVKLNLIAWPKRDVPSSINPFLALSFDFHFCDSTTRQAAVVIQCKGDCCCSYDTFCMRYSFCEDFWYQEQWHWLQVPTFLSSILILWHLSLNTLLLSKQLCHVFGDSLYVDYINF